MEREVGGGVGMGTTCKPMAVSFQCMTKSTTKKKTNPSASFDYTKASESMDHNKLWKILKEIQIPDHLTCLLRNLYARQAATVRTGHGTIDWFQIEKGECQGCILSPCLCNLYAEYIM